MAVTVTHAFVSAVPDSDDTSLVRPSNWNADHTIVGLGTAAEADTGDFATAAQGALADSAVQPASIGTSVQAYSANLDEYATVNPTAAGLALLDDAAASDQRTTLGLGTSAVKNTGASGDAVPLLNTSVSFSEPFEIKVTTDAAVNQPLTITREVTAANSGPTVAMQRARAGPAVVQNGDRIGEVGASGYDGTAVTGYPSQIPFVVRMFATETWSTTANGTRCEFLSTLTGTVTRAARLTIEGNGLVTIPAGLGRGAPVTKTADFTIALGENWLINNKAGSACTVTLPTASAWTGREIMFQSYQAQTTVSASSNVVQKGGATTTTAILPATIGAWCIMVSNGTNWVIMLSGT